MEKIDYFDNDSQAFSLPSGEGHIMNIENGTDAVSIHGSLEITPDKAGFAALCGLIDQLTLLKGRMLLTGMCNRQAVPSPSLQERTAKNPFRR